MAEPLSYKVDLETVIKAMPSNDNFHWFHPRATAMPGGALLTIQKLLEVSDYFSGLNYLTRQVGDEKWIGPCLPSQLDWQHQANGVTISVGDVTPGYHAPTGKVIAIGAQVRYNPAGQQLADIKRAHQTVYAVYDPSTDQWTPWQRLELPEGEEYNFARSACSQWVVKADGSLLVPFYVSRSVKERFNTIVAECRFDGEKLSFVKRGNVLSLAVGRGLYEPSLIDYQGRYFLTMRNDEGGYVSTSDDGLNFTEPSPWLFDDGTDLGSYNTQQHWLAHSEGLFLIYTRRGAENDHIMRHRAPLFMAEIDPDLLQVKRASERTIVPERGATLGNFGANPFSPTESWITVSERFPANKDSNNSKEAATYLARIIWSQPNQLLSE